MKRLLTPSLNSAGLIAAANALYAITEVILRHYHVAWGLSPAQIATLDGFALAWIRTQVTPIADPKDGNRQPLGPPTMRQVAAAARRLGFEVVPEDTYNVYLSNVPPVVTSTGPPGSTVTYQDAPPDVHDQPPPPGA